MLSNPRSGDKTSFTPYPTAVILHQIEPHSLNTAIITASVNLEKEVYHSEQNNIPNRSTSKHPENKIQKQLVLVMRKQELKPKPAQSTTKGPDLLV